MCLTAQSTGPERPALSLEAIIMKLNLTPDELTALSRQGVITSQLRGRGNRVYKLRFRHLGRQQVRYLGSDVSWVAEVRAALLHWQTPRQLKRRLASRVKQTRDLLRSIRPRLGPLVAQAGLQFHGRTLRRVRQPVNIQESQNTSR
jgi:hypothetical protein